MAYDLKLADRMRAVLRDEQVVEKKMFGGLAFMVKGHMCCGIIGNDLCVRVGNDALQRALKDKGARPMDFTGRPSKNMVYVSPAGVKTARELRKWVDRALEFVKTLPR